MNQDTSIESLLISFKADLLGKGFRPDQVERIVMLDSFEKAVHDTRHDLAPWGVIKQAGCDE